MNTRTKYQVKYLQQKKEKKTTEKDQEGYKYRKSTLNKINWVGAQMWDKKYQNRNKTELFWGQMEWSILLLGKGDAMGLYCVTQNSCRWRVFGPALWQYWWGPDLLCFVLPANYFHKYNRMIYCLDNIIFAEKIQSMAKHKHWCFNHLALVWQLLLGLFLCDLQNVLNS